MGQIVRRKRKGRSSNSDRARINSSAAPPSPVDRRRSRRRRNVRYNFDIDDYVDDDEFDDDDEDEEVGRREKKLRLLLYDDDDSRSNRRVTHAPTSSSSSEDDYDEDDDFKYSKKRKISGGHDVHNEDNEIEEIRGRKFEEEDDDDYNHHEEEEEEAPGGSDFDCVGAASDSQKEVPLPDKKTLELILDKLQKKDIYGVYSEPVDHDELPDYHDVIKHPMDFSTVRKKLAKGAYLTLKEFERDVFLICSNAMQYNAPDTIYYKQASSIQEQAKLRFQRLRANTDRPETELKPEHKAIKPSFSPPKKQLNKPVGRPVHDPVSSETLSGANLRVEEFPNGSSAQTPVRPSSSEILIPENTDNSLDKEQELVVPGKSLMPKLGRKPVEDENRRATYDKSIETEVPESSSVFSIFEGESKQFIPVGLHVDHSYARSLARYAATLGSVAWKVASKTIEQALPKGVKYGRGWVGEYEPLPTPVVLMPGDHQANFLSLFKLKEASKTIHKSSRTFKESVKRQSPREAIKDLPRPFFSKFGGGSNLVHQNSFKKPGNDVPPQVELNHPPTRHPVHNGSDIRSPRPIVSLPSFKHPNIENDGFAPGRPKTEQPRLSDPVHMMKMLAAEKGQNQNGFCFSSKREDSNNGASTIHPHFPIKVQQQPQEVYSNGSNREWMSLGGTGTGNTNGSVGCLYNIQQNQVSRFRGEFGVHFQQQPIQMMNEGHLGFSQRVQVQPPGWRGVPYQMQQQMRPIKQQESRPPDLNIGYQSPARQSTGMLVDSQQPDLALQL